MQQAIVPSAFSSERELELNRFACRFYMVGSCSDGPYCPLPHVQDRRRTPDTTCRFYFKGKCIYGKTCWYDHVYFKMKGQKITMTLHKDQAQYRYLLRKAEEDEKKKIKDNEDAENVNVLPCNQENLILNNSNHTSGCELKSKDIRAAVKSEEEASYNPFLNYDKAFPCLSRKKENQPEFVLKTTLKTEKLHFLHKKQLKIDDNSQLQNYKDDESMDYLPNTLNEPTENVQLQSSDLSDVFQKQNLHSSKDGENTYYMPKGDSKLINIPYKTSDKVDVVEEISPDLNTNGQITCYLPMNKTLASSVRNDSIPSSSNALHSNLLQWYAKKHAFQQEILGLNKNGVSTYTLSKDDNAVIATENIDFIAPSSNILSCNMKNSIKEPSSKKLSIHKEKTNVHYSLKNHNRIKNAKNTSIQQTSNVLYSNSVNECSKTHTLLQNNLNLDKYQMNIHSLPRNINSGAFTENISIPQASKFMCSTIHKKSTRKKDGLKKKMSLRKIVTNTCTLQKRYNSLDPPKNISNPNAYKNLNTLFPMSSDSSQQNLNFSVHETYYLPRNAVITTKNFIPSTWFYFPIMINLNCPDMPIMTIQQKMMFPVPEQIWNSEYPLPKEFYSNSTKTSRLSIYLNMANSSCQTNT